MAAKPKSDESFKSKIKSFFFGLKPHQEHSSDVHLTVPLYIVTAEIRKNLSRESPIHQRLKTVKDLQETIEKKCLEEHAIEVLWDILKDLLTSTVLKDDRQTVLQFFIVMAKTQEHQMGIMKLQFFQFIENHKIAEDFALRLILLDVLTHSGRVWDHLEERCGAFLLGFLSELMTDEHQCEFLQILVNVIKFNSVLISEDILVQIIKKNCGIVRTTSSEDCIKGCLQVLDATICYRHLPVESLLDFLLCMCQLVFVDIFSHHSWQLVRKLFGTHLGHHAIFALCCILQDPHLPSEHQNTLLRGAVFFIGMVMWGSNRVQSLHHPFSSVLPPLYKALMNSHSCVVGNELALTLHRLITKYSTELHMNAWNCVMDIMQALLSLIQTPSIVTADAVASTHDLLTAIETAQLENKYLASKGRLFELIETCSSKRPDSSIVQLLDYKANKVKESDYFVLELKELVEKYFRVEGRTKIRLKSLHILENFINIGDKVLQDQLIAQVIVPSFQNIAMDTDEDVKLQSVKILGHLALECTSVLSYKLLDILKQIVLQPSHTKAVVSESLTAQETGSKVTDREPGNKQQVTDAITWLNTIFYNSLRQPEPGRCVKVFNILVEFLKCEYDSSPTSGRATVRRMMVLQTLLRLRANSSNCVGIVSPDCKRSFQTLVEYSTSVTCVAKDADFTAAASILRCSLPLDPDMVSIPFATVFKIFYRALEMELNWPVLKLLLEELPAVFQNKALLLACDFEDFKRFSGRLCAMISKKIYPDCLVDKPPQFNRSQFHSYIYPVMTAFLSYHRLLDKSKKSEILSCLEFGLVSKYSCIVCIHALTVCALEIQDIAMKHLPSVLLKMSQISATAASAVPIMEFLSSLCHIPQLYTNFVEKEYLSIFAIVLPYTDPFKYNHYTVSLAYHVIAMWFLKCRLPLRRTFVGYIVRGLRTNVMRQFEELATSRTAYNQDSSDRLRTQSLNDEALRSANRQAAAAAAAAIQAKQIGTAEFHKDLMHTCMDLLARYTFSNCTSLPKRSPVTRFLLEGGQEKSWLVDNNIITVTTSGGSKVTKSGLCIKCLQLARTTSDQQSQSASEESSLRKRHKSAFTQGVSETVVMRKHSQDDLSIARTTSQSGASLQVGSQSETSLQQDLPALDRRRKISVPLLGSASHVYLETINDKQQAVDSVLMSLPVQASDRSIFSSNLCNCWCTQWAEIFIRRPTGNIAWMMRMENDQDLLDIFPDFSLADISNLFTVGGSHVEGLDTILEEDITPQPIDSQLLPESHYEHLWEKHFHHQQTTDAFVRGVLSHSSDSDGGSTTESLEDLPKSTTTVTKGHPAPRRRMDLTIPIPEEVTGGSIPSPTDNVSLPSSSQVNISGRSNPNTPSPLTSDRPPTPSPSSSEFGFNLGKSVSSTRLFPQRDLVHGGLNPAFVFLQLYHSQYEQFEDRPLEIIKTEQNNRSLFVLDKIYPYETYKIGVVYIGPSQADDETAILSNLFGSPRYMSFVEGLGQLVDLVGIDQSRVFIGGLNDQGEDGQFSRAWHDEIMQVIFHITTLMPNSPGDPKCNSKKRHIGNNFVTIVYNDSSQQYKLGTLKSQFNFVNIIIEPLDHGMNAVTVQTKPGIEDTIGHKDTKVISDANLSFLVRLMAVHANLASIIESRPDNPYASNWLERLRVIKRLQERLGKEQGDQIKNSTNAAVPNAVEDFTEFIH